MAKKKVAEQRIENLRALLAEFPTTPGVYLMKNAVDKIIYVGKAKILRSRVRSYFNAAAEHSGKTRSLVSHIEKIEYILTNTEVEALLLEASMIKKHRPKYNVLLKDDKTYPYIKVSMSDDFPRFYLARKVRKDGGFYFGPYTSGLVVYETIKFLNRTFQIRDCNDHFMRNRTRPCLSHQIGNCSAPCVNLVTKEKYAEDIAGALLFLRGRDKQVLKVVTEKMKAAASLEHFEIAAKFRDCLEALKKAQERQAVIRAMSDKDQDVIGYHGDERGCMVEVLHVRQGKLLGGQNHFLPLLNPDSPDENPQEWLTSFISQYYVENYVPDELLVPVDLGGDINKLLGGVLKERGDKPTIVRFTTDREGTKLVEMAEHNAMERFKHHVTKTEKKLKGLEDIKNRLSLEQLPLRIECYDISNFQGAESVASQVVFEDGVPNKDEYRRYKIKTVEGANDFAMMKEVLSRRLKHDEMDEPQLIVVDGGKGQLSLAREALKELGRENIPIVGLAKARTKGSFKDKDVESTEERVFIHGRENAVTFPRGSEALHILAGIRDEAHRFAITYHRKLREAGSLASELDAVVGLGEKRKNQLLKKYESLDQLKHATVEELAELPGFNTVLAARILLHLNEEPEN